jgi:hypothetical protein
MSVPYNGGPAFPRPASVSPRVADIKQQDGMTLRDWFAGQAMQGFIACPDTQGEPEGIATWCYQMADAMLKARES